MNKSKSAIFLMIPRLMATFIRLVSIPFYASWMGHGNLGAYFFAFGLVLYFGFLDIGFTFGANQKMIEADHSSEDQRFWNMWSTNLILALGVGLLGLITSMIVGSLLTLKDFTGTLREQQQLFFLTGLFFLFNKLSLASHTALTARSQFNQLAKFTSFSLIASSLAMFLFGYLFRSPVGLMLGMVVEPVICLSLILFTLRNEYLPHKFLSGFKMEDVKSFGHFGIQSYFAAVFGLVGTNIDQVLLGSVIGMSILSAYTILSRLPQTLYNLSQSVTQTILPELTKSFQSNRTEFEEKLNAHTRIIMAFCCVLIIVPCFLGRPILDLWMKKPLHPHETLIFAGMGIYWALELYYGGFVMVSFAAKLPMIGTPFAMFNALTSLVLALPMYRAFGLLGLMMMKVGIDLLQFIPLHYVFFRVVKLNVDFVRLMRDSFLMLGFSVLLGSIAMFFAQTPWLRAHSLLSAALAPFWSLLCAIGIFRFGFSPFPLGAKKLLGARLMRLFLAESPYLKEKSMKAKESIFRS